MDATTSEWLWCAILALVVWKILSPWLLCDVLDELRGRDPQA